MLKMSGKIIAGQSNKRFSALAIVYAAGFIWACSSSKAIEQSADCINAQRLVLTTSHSDVLILQGYPQAITLSVVAISEAVDGTTQLVDVPFYFVDVSGDGFFELAVTQPPMTSIHLNATGEYPIQVTTLACSGILVARSNVTATVVNRPTLRVELTPSSEQPIPVNTPIYATLTVNAGANSPPLTLTWQWPNGVTGFISYDQPFAIVGTQALLTTPGFKTFRATVVDRYGQMASEVVTIVLTLPTVDTFALDFGGQLRGFDIYTPWLAPQPGTHVAMAAAASGLVIARLAPTGAEFVSRFDPAFPLSRTLREVWLDEQNQIAYAAAGDGGLYVMDVSNAAAPRLLPPGQILPFLNYVNVTRAWVCGRRVYYLNEGDGIYGIELTDVALLAEQRSGLNLDRFAWDYIRAVTGDSQTPTLKLLHPETIDMACPNEQTLVVADQAQLTIYDLASFFGPEQAASIVVQTSLDLNWWEPEAVAIAAVAAATAPVGQPFTVAVALANNGHAEYLATPVSGGVDFVLKRHRLTLRDNSSFSPDQFIAERHVQTMVHGWESFYWVNGLQSADAFMAFDNTSVAGAISQTIVYSPGRICSPTSANFTAQTACVLGVAVKNVVSRQPNKEFLAQKEGGIQLFTRDGSRVKDYDLPFMASALALSDEEYWVFGGDQLLIFERSRVETAEVLALQVSPNMVTTVGIATLAVWPSVLSNELLLVGDGSLAWLERNTRQTLATVALGHGIYASAFDQQRGIAAIVDAEANRLRLWRRSGSLAVPGLVSSQTGFWGVAACPGLILAWEGGVEAMRLWRLNNNGTQLQQVATWPFAAYIAVACNENRIFVATGAFGGYVQLSEYARSNLVLLSQQTLPALINQDVHSINLQLHQDWLGVQIRGRGSFFFDLRQSPPQMLAADYFEKIANGLGFAVLDVGIGLRYAVLTYEPDASPAKLLIKRAEP